MAAQFEDAGWRVVRAGGPCDVAVIHSCAITHRAERDSVQWARRIRRLGARIVVLAGCAVEQNGEALKNATGADLVVGQAQKFNLPARLATGFGMSPPPARAERTARSQSIQTAPMFASTRALVKVQDGCSFRCSYCVIPNIRGNPHSRPLGEVLDDIRRLIDAGYREITLVAANLGCYQTPSHSLIDLLEGAETINGLERLRIGSIESSTVERSVIDFMAASTKLCHYLHLPLQSGDDTVLRRMRRRYTAAQYGATVEYAALRIPDIGLGTDVIVGFPGEDERAFHNTIALIRDLPFSNLHVFPYSPRSGTAAAVMPHPVGADIKRKRAGQLIALGSAKRTLFAESCIGKPVSLLVERPGSTAGVSGWTGHYLPVRITGAAAPANTILTCSPDRVENETLVAENILDIR